MDWIEDFDLFLFDFDGLLVDTESLHFRAYIKALAHFQEKLPWGYLTFLGHAHISSTHLKETLEKEFPKVFASLSWEAFYARKKKIYESLLEQESPTFMQGAEELLKTLQKKGKTSVIVTNSFRRQIAKISEDLPLLKGMSSWITKEDYRHAKPSPECYETAIRMFPNAKRIIGLEDSLRGITALKKAPLTAVFVQQNNYPLVQQALSLGVVHVTSLLHISRDLLHHKQLP